MTAILKVDTIQDTSGNNIINESSDTITIGASGDTTNIIGTLQNNGSALSSGITEADQWRLTTAFTGNAEPISSNLERNDTQFSHIGSGMSESSGVFTFPSTGIYLIRFYHMFQFKDGNALSRDAKIMHTTNNSSYSAIGLLNRNGLDEGRDIRSIEAILDVTDTSNIKVRFDVTGASTNDRTTGDSTLNETCMTFIRLGDT